MKKYNKVKYSQKGVKNRFELAEERKSGVCIFRVHSSTDFCQLDMMRSYQRACGGLPVLRGPRQHSNMMLGGPFSAAKSPTKNHKNVKNVA